MKRLTKAIAILSAICMCVPAVCAVAACAPVADNRAYQTWLDSGHKGTEEDFQNWIKNGGDATQSGDNTQGGTTDDDKAYQIWLEQGNKGSKEEFLKWLADDHTPVTPKDTAYEIWLSNGYSGTKEDYLEWLRTDGGRNAHITDEASLTYAFDTLYMYGELHDAKRGLSRASDLTGARFSIDGKYVDTYTSYATADVKFEFYGQENTRIADIPGGIAYTLPTTSLQADYSISKYRVQYKFDNCVLTTSVESGNPYSSWYTYGYEWLLLYINDDEYISKNNLERINGTHAYEFTKDHAYGDKTTKAGFDYYRFDIHVKDSGDTEYPYYHVAILRPESDIVHFTMFVLKSAENQKETMDQIVDSYRTYGSMGTAKNYYNAGKPLENPRWDDKTSAYFNKLMNGNSVQWGAFSASMLQESTLLDPDLPEFKERVNLLNTYEEAIEKIWGYDYDICPTYGHISWYSIPHYFPLEMAKAVADGDGVNGKPVLQFSYQFTTNNNMVAGKITPAFDIMRGRYDEHFHRLATDIKAYENPVLFRLNNEMNSDWTSYCGMMTLLDPDIFTMTWKRLYDIFEEEDVTNVIWIWNPNDKSAPYSSWGEDLCYFPGRNYVQLLGGTSYEMNNGNGGVANSFRNYYSELYDKNKAVFSQWGMTISEFACGSGGEVVYSGGQWVPAVSGRNRASQATYITNMFKELNAENKPDWVKMIKGAIWFNVNDSTLVDGAYKVTNRLRFYEPNSAEYDDLSATYAAFKAGFAKQKEMAQAK